MKKKAILFVLTVASMLALSACSGSSSGKKKCDGETCPIGYRYQGENARPDIVIR